MKRTDRYGEVVEVSYELGLKTYDNSENAKSNNSLETYDGIYCHGYIDARKKVEEYIKKIGQQVRGDIQGDCKELVAVEILMYHDMELQWIERFDSNGKKLQRILVD